MRSRSKWIDAPPIPGALICNIGDMLGAVLRRGGDIGVCGTCMDARGITAELLIEGANRSTMAQLTEWTAAADKVLVF